MSRGILYVMSTCVDGLIKIGKTSDFENRMSLLERDGYHRISVLKREFAIEVDDYEEKEVLLHEIFSKSRVGDSELFSIDINLVIQLMSSMDGKLIYPLGNKETIFDNAVINYEHSSNSIIPNGLYYCEFRKNKKDYAKGLLEVENGVLTLKKGSIFGPAKEYISDSAIKIRDSAHLSSTKELQEDITNVSSLSVACSAIDGGSKNGWDEWKSCDNDIVIKKLVKR